MEQKIILGLVSLVAGGKGTATAYLKDKYGAVTFRFSDPFRETLDLYDLDVSRDNMQKLSTLMRQNFGEDVLAKAISKKARIVDNGLVVVDGVRRFTDIENLVKLPEFNLVAIMADQKLRYQRYVQRNENPGDDSLTFEQFCLKESAEAESQIPEVIEKAQFTLNNNGSLEQLYSQIDDILNKIKAKIYERS